MPTGQPSINQWLPSIQGTTIDYVNKSNTVLPDGAKELTALVMSVVSVLAKNEVLNIRETCNEFFDHFDKFGGVKSWGDLSDVLKTFMEDFRDSMPEEERVIFKLENEGRWCLGNKRR